MSSAWGYSFGSAWGGSWGALAGAGGGTGGIVPAGGGGGWRRRYSVFRDYEDAIRRVLEHMEQPTVAKVYAAATKQPELRAVASTARGRQALEAAIRAIMQDDDDEAISILMVLN